MERKFYAIGHKQSVTYGHGSCGSETHIEPINAYMGNYDYHPIFEDKKDAEYYLKNLTLNFEMTIVELTVYKK